jgi:iron(III) transport system substrate-binding protein
MRVCWVVAAVVSTLLVTVSSQAEETVDLAAAKAEGRVVWYTSAPIAEAQKLAKLFEARTGIAVELFRSGGTAILRRFQQESDGGSVAADVLSTADPASAVALAKKGLFVAFQPRHFDQIAASAKDRDGFYVPYRLNLVTLFVRTDKVAVADVPKTWDDLASAKYKGAIVLTDPSFTSLQLSVVGMLARAKGWDFYEHLRRNDAMVVSGNQQLADMLKRGERLIAAGGLDSYAVDARRQGHPIAGVFPSDGTFAVPGPSSVVKGSPHPNAAKALAEFLISDEAQTEIVADGVFSPRTDLPAPAGSPRLSEIKLLDVDYGYIEKNAAMIKSRFNDIFQ